MLTRKESEAALEKVAVKAAHFISYEYGPEHCEEMRAFLGGDRFNLYGHGEVHDVQMPFENVVLMLAEEYEWLGMFIGRNGKIGYQLPCGVEVFAA